MTRSWLGVAKREMVGNIIQRRIQWVGWLEEGLMSKRLQVRVQPKVNMIDIDKHRGWK